MEDTDSSEVERLKERLKVNFFQIEKSLAEYDTRMDNFEKNLRKIDASLKKAGSSKPVFAAASVPASAPAIDAKFEKRLAEKIGESLSKEIGEKMEERLEKLHKAIQGNLVGLSSLERRLEGAEKSIGPKGEIKESISDMDLALNKLENALTKKIEASQKAMAEVKLSKPLAKPDPKAEARLESIEKSLKSVEKAVSSKSDTFKRAEDELRKLVEGRLKLVQTVDDKFSDIEGKIDAFGKDYNEMQALKTELEADRKLYSELRAAALESIERLTGVEKDFSLNLEELGKIEDSAKETMALSRQVSEETRKEILRMDKEAKALLDNFLDFKEELNEAFSAEALALDEKRHTFERSFSAQTRAEIARLEGKIGLIGKELAQKQAVFEKGIEKGMDGFDKRNSILEKNMAQFQKDTEEGISKTFALIEGKANELKANAEVLNKQLVKENEGRLKEIALSAQKLESSARSSIQEGLSKIEGRGNEIEKKMQLMHEGFEEAASKRMDAFQDTLQENVDFVLSKQSKRINSFGEQVREVRVEFNRVKSDVVEKTIDDEMNKLLIILSEKMKGLTTQDQFDQFREELRYKIDKIRSPETKPLEARIYCLEEDLAELKKLIRGISQRLPVVVE